ncbi:MAG TPA: MFS transporter [Ktedonobacterales bacterium]|nr:MFS transporter [Ktedonobacterales bacterium]
MSIRRGARPAFGWPVVRRSRPSSGSKTPDGIFSALRHRNYRLFWFGQLVSVTGTFMQSTAQQWLVLTLTPNPLALGIVGALQFGPLLIPFGGAIADRWPRRNVLMATQTAAGLLALILFALTVTHAVQLWQVYVLALMLGIVNAVDMPTRQAFVSEMVPADSLLNAVSLNSAQFNASRIVGPGLAGALIALFGVPPLFLLNAVSFIAVIFGLLMMNLKDLVPVPRAEFAHGIARIRALGDGFRFILSDPTMRVTFLMIAVIGTMGFNFNVVLPLEAYSVLHAGPAVFGWLSSALGAGALIGALTLAKRGGRPTNKQLVFMAAGFGILEATIGLTHSILTTMLLIALSGFFMSSFSASANTRTQLSSPAAIRGRVMSVYTMVFVGTTPIGNLIVSGVAARGGVSASWVVAGLPCLFVALVAAFLWRRQDQQQTLLAAAPVEAAPPVPGSAPVDALPAPPNALLPEMPQANQTRLPRLGRTAPGQPKPQPRAANRN